MRKDSFVSQGLADVSVVVGRHGGNPFVDILVNPDSHLCGTALVSYGMGRESSRYPFVLNQTAKLICR